ncbi:hypothetical protein LINPERHAP2_LOCUS9233 [Linum perenne]
MTQKLHMLQRHASQHNRGLPMVELFLIDHPSCVRTVKLLCGEKKVKLPHETFHNQLFLYVVMEVK